MSSSRQRYLLEVMSGSRRGPRAALLRLFMTACEPPYATVMRLRNWLYDRRMLSIRALPKPTISIGNITTGGTGKTPLVRWLAESLGNSGRHPAILLRGYKSTAGRSDEQALLAETDGLPVIANPNRQHGAASALSAHPHIDVFILDDAMQHRRVARDLDIVLISATEPFGFGHVLPRGLLRESLTGLKRAGALVITHAGEVTPAKLADIESTLRLHNAAAPIFKAEHVHTSLRVAGQSEKLPMTRLAEMRYFVACGIGQPESLVSGLKKHGPGCVGSCFFADHHDFTANDIADIRKQAEKSGAQAIIVTEKDWTKLFRIPTVFEPGIPFWRVVLGIQFWDDGGSRLLELVRNCITCRIAPSPGTPEESL